MAQKSAEPVSERMKLVLPHKLTALQQPFP